MDMVDMDMVDVDMVDMDRLDIDMDMVDLDIEIHICIFNKMQKTGFKHKYPTIEFNSENPKKEC